MTSNFTEEDADHLDSVLRHISHVRENCDKLGRRLMKLGEEAMGLGLIRLGLIHDNSKLHGTEWLYLRPSKFSTPEGHAAIYQHITTNPHHPEYWEKIQYMPRIYVAEMVCDLAARSSEFGNDVREWIKEEATKKFEFTMQSKVGKQINELTNILLDKAFKS